MSYFIFFTGLPRNYPQQSIRDLFSRCGNVVSMKLSTRTSQQQQHNKTISDVITQSGLVEYPDEASQQAAIASFNGYTIDTPRGPVKIRVGVSTGASGGGNRRGREDTGPSSSSSSSGFARYVDSDLAYSEHEVVADQQQGSSSSTFLRHSSTKDPLQMSLRAAPPRELSEAVEQLRVMCLEQPEKARILLDTFPQLRRAVCLILQKEEKLPVPLPPEAFVERKVLLQQQQQQNENDAEGGDKKVSQDGETASSSAPTTSKIDEEEQEKIANIINELSPEALQELLVTDFESQEGEMDETVRQHFMKIQRQLRAMAEEA